MCCENDGVGGGVTLADPGPHYTVAPHHGKSRIHLAMLPIWAALLPIWDTSNTNALYRHYFLQ